MIDQPTIDRILDAAQIVDVVSDFVTLRKRGVNYVGYINDEIRRRSKEIAIRKINGGKYSLLCV